MDRGYEFPNLKDEGQQYGDQFEQQIDEQISNLNKPFISETQLLNENHAVSIQNYRGIEHMHSINKQSQKNSPRKPDASQYVVGKTRIVEQLNGRHDIEQLRVPIQARGQQFYAQPHITRAQITINGRVPSPNRFYPQGRSSGAVSASITPPKPVSVGVALHHNQPPPHFPQPVSSVRVENNQTLIRSRVISQVQKPPIFYMPPNVNVKPQSTNVIRSEDRVRPVTLQQAAQFNRSLQANMHNQAQRVYQITTGSRLQERPTQTQSRIPSPVPYPNPQVPRIVIAPPKNFISSPVFQAQQQVGRNVHVVHPQPIESVTETVKQGMTQQQLIQIHQVITKYEQMRTEVKQVGHQAHMITEMIKIMLSGEEDANKLDFIANLMKEQTILEDKLAGVQKQLDDYETSKQHSTTSAFMHKEVGRPNQQFSSITAQLQAELLALKQKIQALEIENENLLSKNLILQEQHESPDQHLSYESLLETIESQKSIIKRLEQELISTNNQPISQQTSQNSDDAIKSVQSKFMAIIDSKQAYINQLQAEIIRHKTQIKSLKQQVIKEKNERNLLEQASEELERQSHQQSIKSHAQPNNNSKELEKLQKILKQKEEELDHVKQKIFQIQEQFDQTIDERDQKIKQLHEQVIAISEKSILEKKQQTEQISSQLQLTRSELNTKSEELKKSKDRVGQLENIVKDLQNEKLKLSETLKEMTVEEDRLRLSLNSRQNELKSRGNQEEVKVIIEQLRARQNELAKQKQIEYIHLSMIQELEKQIDGLKQGYKNMEVSIVEERRLSTQRYTEYQNKIKMISSRGEPQPREQEEEEEVEKLQGVITEMREKIKKLEDDHQLQQSTVTNQQEQRDFRLQYSTSQVKIFELENTLKQRENRIRQLQSNIETLRLKINHNTNTEQDMMMNQEIQMLRRKVEEYESAAKGNHEPATFRMRDYQSNSVFEQRVIYELKAENQRLKNLLKDPYSSTSSPKKYTRTSRKLNTQQQSCIENIQMRLAQFNKKLNQIIKNNRRQSSMNSSYEGGNNQQLLNVLQKEKIHLAKAHHRQIEALQARIVDLQRYCSSLEFREGIASFDYSCSLRQSVESESKNMYSEQIEYYKEKNKQLETRVDTLLSLNKELKDKLAMYMKPQSEHNIQFYKQQMEKLQARIVDLQNIIKTMKEEKNSLVATIHKFQSDKSAQNMIQSLEHSLQEQIAKSQKLQQHNGLLELELKKYTQQVIDFSTEKLAYKSTINDLENKVSGLEQVLKKGNNQIEDLQLTVVKLKNQIEVLKSEIDRLKEDLGRNKGDSEREVAALKAKVSDLQQQLRQLENGIQTTEHESFSKDQTISMLNGKIMTLERNLTAQISKTTSLTQKLTTIQAQLTRISNQKSELALLIQKQNSEIASLTKRVKQMKEEKDRIAVENWNSQQKISQLEDILRRLRQQLDLYKQSKAKLMQQKYSLQQELFNKIADLDDLTLQINKMRFHIQFIRSVLIEVDVLTAEIVVDGREEALSTLRQEIGKGLVSCEQVFVHL